MTVPITSDSECNSTYADFGGITDRMICAGDPNGETGECQVKVNIRIDIYMWSIRIWDKHKRNYSIITVKIVWNIVGRKSTYNRQCCRLYQQKCRHQKTCWFTTSFFGLSQSLSCQLMVAFEIRRPETYTEIIWTILLDFSTIIWTGVLAPVFSKKQWNLLFTNNFKININVCCRSLTKTL